MRHISESERERRAAQSTHDRILRDSEVRHRTGLSRTTRWRLIRKNKFPRPVSITESAIGWRESEINAWIEARHPKHGFGAL